LAVNISENTSKYKENKMKRLFLSLMLSAGMAHTTLADISVAWDSDTYFYLNGGDAGEYPGDYVPVDALHVLIWSSTAAPSTNWATLSGVGDDEFALWNTPEDMDAAGGIFNYIPTPQTFTDADVGGADINSGYLYSRIFSSANLSTNDWYFQSAAIGPGLTETIVDGVPTLPINHTTSDFDDNSTLEMGVGAGMYQVIPEPSVMALLGFGGLVLAIRRRMTLA
jgi:hypothetical protein